jgi:hypothetical protein
LTGGVEMLKPTQLTHVLNKASEVE